MIPQLYLIGLIPNGDWQPEAVRKVVAEADIIAGGTRFLDFFPDFKGQKIPLAMPLKKWLEDLAAKQKEGLKIVVFTSGDPNFFGLAKCLLDVFPAEHVTIWPSITVIQQAFARLKISWRGAEIVSLHGRDNMVDFWAALYRASHYSGSGYLAIYTDEHNTPAAIAKKLLGRGQYNWNIHVFEDLGTEKEKVSVWTLFEAKLCKFSPLNLVILESLKRPAPIFIGMPEEAYAHEAGLITKREIRAAALGLLEIQPYHTVWDLGSGSGSVSIEAAALVPHGSVWAVEKSPLRAKQIVANRAFFGAVQVEVVEDDALKAMEHLPPPDRIFIGGGGENLGDIIMRATRSLKPNGIVVASMVSFDSFHQAMTKMQEAGLEVTATQMQVARSAPLAGSHFFKSLNQIWLVRGVLRKSLSAGGLS